MKMKMCIGNSMLENHDNDRDYGSANDSIIMLSADVSNRKTMIPFQRKIKL